jgi:hypothetical protein
VVLSLTEQGIRAYAFVLAYAAICILSSLVSVWFPAVGAYASYGVSGDDRANINTHFGFHPE